MKKKRISKAEGGKKSKTWEIRWLEQARKDARKILPNDAARAQLQEQVNRLRHFGDHDFMCDVELKQLRGRRYRDIWELCVKGGALGRINIRVFFAFIDEDESIADERFIAILGAVKKEKEDGINHIYEKMRNRLNDVKYGKQIPSQ